MFFATAAKNSIQIIQFNDENKDIIKEAISDIKLIQWSSIYLTIPKPINPTDILLVKLDIIRNKEVTPEFVEFVKLTDTDTKIFLPEVLKNRLGEQFRALALYLPPGQESKLMYITMKYDVILHITDAHVLDKQLYE